MLPGLCCLFDLLLGVCCSLGFAYVLILVCFVFDCCRCCGGWVCMLVVVGDWCVVILLLGLVCLVWMFGVLLIVYLCLGSVCEWLVSCLSWGLYLLLVLALGFGACCGFVCCLDDCRFECVFMFGVGGGC